MIPTNARRRGGGPPPSPPAAVGGARVPSVGATPTAESSGANPPLAQALRRRAAGGGGGSPPAGARPGRRALPRRPGLRPPVDLSVAGIAAAAALLGLLYLLPAAPPSPLRGGDDISTEYSSAASARAEVPLSKRGISDLRSLGYPPRPRSFGHYFDSAGVGEASGSQRLYTYYHRYPSKRQMSLSEDERDSWKLLKNSKHYRHGQADQFATEECAPQYDWMVTSFPSCNGLHENDLNDLHAAHGSDERTRLVAAGYWRDVWMVRQYDGSRVALKTMRYEHDYEERNYDRHRRDSLAMERLTRSPHVVDTYGFCGNSGLFEFSPGGDINDLVWPDSDDDAPDLEPNEMLRVSVEVAAGVADMHNIDKEGVASIAHTDITPGQFILIDGMYKLNDFNRARFIRWNKAENKPCGYHVGNNPGKFRAPEEYAYEDQSEKIDVYSMGNIFYVILTGEWPFEKMKDKVAHKKIMHGKRPPVADELKESNDSSVQALLRVISMCWEQNTTKRSTAREVSNFLNAKLKNLNVSSHY